MILAALLATAAAATAAVPDSFYCAPWSGGRACFGRIEGYPREVAILVPPGVEAVAPVDLVLYLHGDNVDSLSLVRYLAINHLAEHFARSGRKAIAVFPRSLADSGSRTSDYRDYLAPGPKFQAFLDVVATALGAKDASVAFPRIALAGHSGAYRTLSAILQEGRFADRISEVYLLDAAYGRFEPFVAFAAADPKHRFWSVYSTQGDLGVTNSCIMDLLDARGLKYFGCKPYLNACQRPVVNAACKPPARGDTLANAIGFVRTSEQHNDVPAAYLPDFLKKLSD